MHIAMCGPVSLKMLTGLASADIMRHVGYPFPLLPLLAREYVARGHKVSLVSSSPDVNGVTLYDGRVTVILVPTRRRARDRALDMFAVERAGVSEALELVSPDVIHAHWTYEFAMGAAVARRAPVITTAHDAPLTVLRNLPDAYRLSRLALAARARFGIENLTAVSPYLANRWRSEMLYRRQIKVIPNPVSLPPVGEELSIVDRKPYVLCVADSSRRKNVTRLAEAFKLTRRHFPDLQLELVGPGLGQADEFAQRLVQMGLAEAVRFRGVLQHSELDTLYRNAAVFCHPSLEESQGLVLLEAMSFGLPIVAGRSSGAVAWSLFDGEAAASLCDVRSANELAASLESTLRGDAVATLRGAELRRCLEQRYGLETVSAQYLEAYNEIA